MRKAAMIVGDFLKKNIVFCIAVTAAIVTMFFVPIDSQYIQYFDFKILACIFCVLAVVNGLHHIHFFEIISKKIIQRFRTVKMAVLALIYLTFVASMIIANDLALITFLPLGYYLLKNSDNLKWMAFTFIMQTIAANLGGMLTPFGNPQNLYLYGKFQIPDLEFISTMFLPFLYSIILITITWKAICQGCFFFAMFESVLQQYLCLHIGCQSIENIETLRVIVYNKNGHTFTKHKRFPYRRCEMEGYISIRVAAEKWGVSERRINQYCSEGRIPGAERFGTSWAIPESAEKPGDPRKQKKQAAPPKPKKAPELFPGFMPLINTPFEPGRCMQTIQKMKAGPKRDIALAEYHYFSGQAEKAMQETEVYLTAADSGIRLSACWIFAYSCLTMGRIDHARYALDEIKSTLAADGQTASPVRAMEAFVAFGAAVLLHLPLPEEMPPAEDFLPLLPPGVRAFALYVQAHYLYLKEEYSHSAGIVEAALAMGASAYPISAIYLHLVAVMDYMSMKQTDRAQAHLLTAWEVARPDDLIEGFGEHHGLLGAMLEAAIKPKWPEDFKRIIDITYRFSSGWRRVHNPVTGHDVADDLTTTEFAIAMLAARNWTTQEIAEHLDISANTVKKHIFEAMRKLGIKNRKDLKKYMLQ